MKWLCDVLLSSRSRVSKLRESAGDVVVDDVASAATYTHVCRLIPCSLHWMYIKQSHMHLNGFVVWSRQVKSLHCPPCPSCTLKDMTKPQVCLSVAAALQMRITQQISADTCMTKVHRLLALLIPQPVHHCLSPKGEDWVRTSTSYNLPICCRLLLRQFPDVIARLHARKHRTVTVPATLWKKHVKHTKCIIDVIMSLIQHDTHDWEASQSQ